MKAISFRRVLMVLLWSSVAVLAMASAGLAEILDAGKWDPQTKQRLELLIKKHGHQSPGHNAAKPPYAVFDWDQTCIFNDTQEALFRYMIANLLFKATPEEFKAALQKDVPKDNFKADYNNQAGKPVNIDLITEDLERDYRYLYDNYIKNKKQSLEEIKKTEQFIDFQPKLAYLYEAIGGSFSAEISYPWVLYLFVGLTEAEVAEMAEKSNDAALADSLDTYALTSSRKMPGQAGLISLKGYKRGLRLAPEMSNLMNVLRANGIEVYICSASHEAVVRVFAGQPKYGYNVPPENVIAMKTKIKDGKYLGEYDNTEGYPQTQQAGKTKAIQMKLVSKFGYGPILVAGDSQGDYNMSVDFPETEVTLMINRLRADDFGRLGLEAVEQKGSPEARYILQGRDENIGQFRPSTATIKPGRAAPLELNEKLKAEPPLDKAA